MLKGFFDILIEYNEGVKDGTINRVDEFLRFYGNGDAKKGLQYIKDDLLNVDMASHYLSDTFNWGIVGFGAETFADLRLKVILYKLGIPLFGKEAYNEALKFTKGRETGYRTNCFTHIYRKKNSR